jgi:predicted nucleic-acid-binding protein
VEAFDTNVVVRLCVRDDEEQYRRAERIFRQATAGKGAWLSSVVLVEVTWVLRVAYKFDRPTVAATLRRLIAIDGVYLEDEATTRLALAAFEAGTAEFCRLLHLGVGPSSGALPLHTSDERLGKADSAKLVD